MTIAPLLLNDFPNTRDVIAINLIKMLIDGPLVSFIGSPTVSPTTAFLCGSVFFLKVYPSITKCPCSIYFLALSQAPPELDIEIPIWTPEQIAPANSPHTPLAPNKNPKMIGERITKSPGKTIDLIDALVEILMHAS